MPFDDILLGLWDGIKDNKEKFDIRCPCFLLVIPVVAMLSKLWSFKLYIFRLVILGMKNLIVAVDQVLLGLQQLIRKNMRHSFMEFQALSFEITISDIVILHDWLPLITFYMAFNR